MLNLRRPAPAKSRRTAACLGRDNRRRRVSDLKPNRRKHDVRVSVRRHPAKANQKRSARTINIVDSPVRARLRVSWKAICPGRNVRRAISRIMRSRVVISRSAPQPQSPRHACLCPAVLVIVVEQLNRDGRRACRNRERRKAKLDMTCRVAMSKRIRRQRIRVVVHQFPSSPRRACPRSG